MALFLLPLFLHHPEIHEDAVQKAAEKVAEGHRNVRWFEVTELKGEVCDNLFCNWQVTLKVGYEMA
jgi:dodecin